MCIGVPGEVIEIYQQDAKVSILGVETVVNIQLIENLSIGDFLLIHTGCAIEKINKEYYDDLYNIFFGLLDEESYE